MNNNTVYKSQNLFDKIAIGLPKFVIIFLTVYTILPFLSPVAFKLGVPSVGIAIQNVYRVFCHQRVERSLFLFPKDGFAKYYTIEELQTIGYLPLKSQGFYGDGWKLYQYPYWGNDVIGYKVAFCIRDIGLYMALSLTSIILYIYINKKKKIVWMKWYWIFLLCLPMMLDGVFQTFVEVFGRYTMGSYYNASWVLPYVANMDKRLLTGALFGMGFAFIVVPNLMDTAEIQEEFEKAKMKNLSKEGIIVESKKVAPDKNM